MYNPNRIHKMAVKRKFTKRLKCKHLGRTILFVSNSIFMIVGTAILFVGVLVVHKAPEVSKTDKIHAFIGICDTTLGVLGMTATFKENSLVILFVMLIVLLIPIHLAFGVEALLKITDEEFYELSIRKVLIEIYSKTKDNIEAAYEMGMIQYYFGCCGINGYKDYKDDNPYLPRSCCKRYPKYCDVEHEQLIKRGCKDVVLKFTLLKRKITGITLLLMLIPLFMVAIFGIRLSEKIRAKTEFNR